MGAVGMWGDYCEREGHGKFVEWERKAAGTLKKIVVPVPEVPTGQVKTSVKVPRTRSALPSTSW